MNEPRKISGIKASLSPPKCRWGYPESQLQDEMPPLQFTSFKIWMRGQTFSACDGRSYNHDLGEYEETGCGPHGYVYYESDVNRFLKGLPVID